MVNTSFNVRGKFIFCTQEDGFRCFMNTNIVLLVVCYLQPTALGHGIEVRGRNFFIPVNADIKRSDEIADQSLDVNLILEKIETAKKGVNILIVDACRDDPFGRSFRSSSLGLANMDAPQGTSITFSTSPGKVAADGEGRNSPYTKNLIKTMQIPNLPIEQFFKQVIRAIQQETKNQQTPWENTSLSGDFYFSLKK